MNSFLSVVHLPIVSFNSFWFGRRWIRWCIAAWAASSASFSVVKCFTAGGFIVSFVGDGPRGLVGACLQIGGRGKVMHGAGVCAGTSDGGGDILTLSCDIRFFPDGRATNIDLFGSV